MVKKKTSVKKAKKSGIKTVKKSKKSIAEKLKIKKISSRKKSGKKTRTKSSVKKTSKPPHKPVSLDFLHNLLEKFGKKKEMGSVESPKETRDMSHITKTVRCEDIMVRNPVTIDAELPLSKAFELLEKHKLRSIIVVEKDVPVGIIDELMIVAFLSSFVQMVPGALSENKEELNKISMRPVSSAMTKIEHFVKKNTPLEIGIKLMNSYKIDQLPVVDNNRVVGSLLEENVLSFIEKQVNEQKIIESSVIETGIDKLLDMINASGELNTKDAAGILKTSVAEIEKWGRILQAHNLIDIDFSTVGIVKLVKKEEKAV